MISCGEQDSPRHVLFECTKYSEFTKQFTDKVRPRNLSEPSWLAEIYKKFSYVIKEVLLAKEMIERLEREKIHQSSRRALGAKLEYIEKIKLDLSGLTTVQNQRSRSDITINCRSTSSR